MKRLIALTALVGIVASGPLFAKDKSQVIDLKVTEKGFEPEKIEVNAGSDVVLKITRTTDSTCAKAIKISSKNIKKDLPLNKTVEVDLGKLEKGDIKFACGMDMATGVIVVQ